jgi:hypothetical protein
MKNFIAILLVTISVFLVSIVQAGNKNDVKSKDIIPSEIIQRINKDGANKVVIELYEDETTWDEIMRKIAGGEKSWLEVAVHLRLGSDADASEMLDHSVGEALESNPSAVLSIALKIFRIIDICHAPDLGDERFNTYRKAKDALERRIRALDTVTDESLIEKRNLCIKKLSHSMTDLREDFKQEK